MNKWKYWDSKKEKYVCNICELESYNQSDIINHKHIKNQNKIQKEK